MTETQYAQYCKRCETGTHVKTPNTELSHARPKTSNREAELTAIPRIGSGDLLGVIYADPPWMYQQKGVQGASMTT